MKILAGMFLIVCFDAPCDLLQAFQTKPEMIVLESRAAKASTLRNFPGGAYTKSSTTTVQNVSGVKKTHVAYTKQTMTALSTDKGMLEIETTTNGSTSKQQHEIVFDAYDVPPKEFTSPPAGSETGSESIMVGKTSLPCKWVIRKTVSPSGQLLTKTWYSAEMPGYIVKIIFHFVGTGLTTDTTFQVTEFKR